LHLVIYFIANFGLAVTIVLAAVVVKVKGVVVLSPTITGLVDSSSSVVTNVNVVVVVVCV